VVVLPQSHWHSHCVLPLLSGFARRSTVSLLPGILPLSFLRGFGISRILFVFQKTQASLHRRSFGRLSALPALHE